MSKEKKVTNWQFRFSIKQLWVKNDDCIIDFEIRELLLASPKPYILKFELLNNIDDRLEFDLSIVKPVHVLAQDLLKLDFQKWTRFVYAINHQDIYNLMWIYPLLQNWMIWVSFLEVEENVKVYEEVEKQYKNYTETINTFMKEVWVDSVDELHKLPFKDTEWWEDDVDDELPF